MHTFAVLTVMAGIPALLELSPIPSTTSNGYCGEILFKPATNSCPKDTLTTVTEEKEEVVTEQFVCMAL